MFPRILRTSSCLYRNRDIDTLSRYFRYTVFDKERNALIATLSIENIVWVIILAECEYSWKPCTSTTYVEGLWRPVSVLGRLDLHPLVMIHNLFNLATKFL